MKKRNGKVAIHYNAEEDSLEIWIKRINDRTWSFTYSTKFRVCRDIDLQALFIHHQILKEIDKWIKWNQYEFIGYISDSELGEAEQ